MNISMSYLSRTFYNALFLALQMLKNTARYMMLLAAYIHHENNFILLDNLYGWLCKRNSCMTQSTRHGSIFLFIPVHVYALLFNKRCIFFMFEKKRQLKKWKKIDLRSTGIANRLLNYISCVIFNRKTFFIMTTDVEAVRLIRCLIRIISDFICLLQKIFLFTRTTKYSIRYTQ